MFEVTGSDIANLGDADLRTLVARLATAELRKQGLSLSSVTAGGNQDAPDGGLDVRVLCPSPLLKPDFVPRSYTGFQVKKSDMPPQAIQNEMRPRATRGKRAEKPHGSLRQVIGELAQASGAYVIVSSQGSVADKPLAMRRKAMRDALHDIDEANSLHTDFYDRDRLAAWVNEYPGIVAWVRGRLGLQMAGWDSIGNWVGTQVAEPVPYLSDDKACLINECTLEGERLTISEGIKRLRAALRTPRRCIRLVGLSGLGKTRLVHALFESSVGDEPLDPSFAIYTDYSVETEPTARDMARQLVQRCQHAILIVDNCNPATHTELAVICSDMSSNVSLLTVEYDVRDDEPEHTEVFRLESASIELVVKWLDHSFPDISEIDQRTIVGFSGSNFRVARALAGTLGKGETLGKLKSRELFERIFQQRNAPDQNLLLAAEELSLLYSVNGNDVSASGELALVGKIRKIDASSLYTSLAELRSRGIVQVRGLWRAILPHAVANRLATSALQRIPLADFDRFSASLTPRMQKSLSRRLGYLHDSPEVREAVARWLRVDGPLGDLFLRGEEGIEILANIAPVAPAAVLSRIDQVLNGASGEKLLLPDEPTRDRWIRLIKILGYEAHMFENAVTLLARFLAAEQLDHNYNSARDSFAELFQLYLSGTHATPDQRRMVVRRLANSEDSGERRCASIALASLLATEHFISCSTFDFGARSRDWGWQPTLSKEIGDWYSAAIDLAVELSLALPDSRESLASSIRMLWRYPVCRKALDRAATELVKVRPWIEGWIAFRTSLRFEGDEMPEPIRLQLEAIIQRLKPSDLLHQARAVVINIGGRGWDIADGEPDDGDAMKPWVKASQMARDVGRLLAQDPETRNEFLAELIAEPRAHRAFECGRGLAEGASDLGGVWRDIAAQFKDADVTQRGAMVLGGFIHEAYLRDAHFTQTVLEAAADDSTLAPILPYLQAQARIDERGIALLRGAIKKQSVKAADFQTIANGVVGESPPEFLRALLTDIAELPEGVGIAVDILHMYFFSARNSGRPLDPTLIQFGRTLLCRANFSEQGAPRDYALHTIIRICCSDHNGAEVAREVCTHIRDAFEAGYLLRHNLSYVFRALFETQPVAALDIFLQYPLSERRRWLFDSGLYLSTPVENIDPMVLRQWAGLDSTARYPLLGKAISMFSRKSNGEDLGLSPLFLEMLEHAPDKTAFLGNLRTRIHPLSWSGSLANILRQRKEQILPLRDSPHSEVRQWVSENQSELDHWIDQEQKRDREEEESFE